MRSVIRTVDVNRPVSWVYDQWTRFEDFPRLMPGVASVRQVDERTTAWVVVIAKERREFVAVVTEQRPDDRIAWKALGEPAHSGVVTFHRLHADVTRITVQLDWEPVGTFDLVGDRLGIVASQIDKALQGLASHVESLPAPVEGWRGTIEPGEELAPSVDAVATGEEPRSGVPRDGKGRTADSPTELPRRGVGDVVKRTFKQLKEDDVQILAAAVAFYFFLALIPTLAASISLYGLLADPADVEQQVSDLTVGLPSAARDLILGQVREIAAAEASTLSISLVISVVVALFSASKGTQALVKAINVAYDEEETRGFLKLRAVAYALTIGIVAVMVGTVAALVLVGEVAGDLPGGGAIITAVRWPVLAALLIVVLAILYRFSADRDSPKWRWTTPGAVAGAVLVAVGSFGLSLYTRLFSGTEASGVLGAVGVLLLWLFVSAYAVLFGAELDSELEHQTARDTTKGPPRPMGRRGAAKADTVAP